MEDKKIQPLPSLPDPVQRYVLDAFGCGNPALGRDLLLSLARRLAYARYVHPFFDGMDSVQDEFAELKQAHAAFEADGDARRMREEAIDVMATCIRLINHFGTRPAEPCVSGAFAGTVAG